MLSTPILLFVFSFGFAQNNSYPINDPRNPQCPCHKYQKLADDEFKKLLALNNTKPLTKEKEISDDAQAKNKKIVHANEPLEKFVGISNDDQEKINKPLDRFVGISNDDLEKIKKLISNHDGTNVLGKINENPGTRNISEQKTDRVGSISKDTHSKTTKHWKGKHKRHNSHYKQLKRIFYVGGWNIWKGKRVTSKCYHWK